MNRSWPLGFRSDRESDLNVTFFAPWPSVHPEPICKTPDYVGHDVMFGPALPLEQSLDDQEFDERVRQIVGRLRGDAVDQTGSSTIDSRNPGFQPLHRSRRLGASRLNPGSEPERLGLAPLKRQFLQSEIDIEPPIAKFPQ